ncbi:MAG: chorismate mutase [Clostridia bacterium]|nr:chorismate mutase [Clostridia bacterium]
MNDLEQARKIINEVDSEMAKLFEKRMEAAQLVAKYKKENALSILDEAREKELILKNSEMIDSSEIKEYYIQFLKNTMSLSRAYQSRLNEGMRVAYCGVPGAYAYIAAKKMFPNCIYVPYGDFNSAYASVENGECDASVLPIENSFAGDVGTVMDLIFSGTLYVNQVIDLAISHNLIACKGATVDSIKKVVSHSQALTQCAEFIKNHRYETEAYANTAMAAEYVKSLNDPSVAAIASDETAKIFDLNILEGNINTSRMNTTRFAAFSRVQNKIDSAKKKMNEHFILVFTVKNEAGALAKTLDIIGAHGFNMRNLRSRPMKELLWNYYFYIEAEGNINTVNGKEMLRELGATCARLKLAGTYYSKLEK